ncbi:MAG: hypothetical protein JWO53_1283 [Chlamydiia bacterium]|nr:hypothetical protein [Chlamydiia bacterium]
MTKIDALLNERINAQPSLSKVKALAQRSSDGSLSSFSGLFKVGELTANEKSLLESILREYQDEARDIQPDLQSLISITSEVKAIHNQAALLHGERIKRVQAILKSYRDGAFTAWLYAAYGNRQTPYNFLLYYEFCETLPSDIRPKVDAMPRQAIYALASRKAPVEKKQEFITSYSGQTKREMLDLIRTTFPLDKEDGRKSDDGQMVLTGLVKLFHSFKRLKSEIEPEKQEEIKSMLTRFLQLVS